MAAFPSRTQSTSSPPRCEGGAKRPPGCTPSAAKPALSAGAPKAALTNREFMHFQLQRSIWTRFGEGKKNVSHRHCLDKHSHLPRSPFHPMTPFAFTLSSWPAQHPFPVCCFALMKSPCKCMGDSFQASTTCTSRASQLSAQLQLVEACLSQLCIGEVVLIGAELWQQSSV